MGAMVPEACAAADVLAAEAGVAADVVVPHERRPRVPRRAGARRPVAGDHAILDELFPRAPLPLVTLLDGHPHTLAFLGVVRGVPITSLGVQRFGQSGDIAELYALHEIDAESSSAPRWTCSTPSLSS